jgi:MFS family permease
MGLGAFNDNYYRNAFAILLTYQLANTLTMPLSVLINIATASFIIPYFFFSGIAGVIADNVAKHRLVRILKCAELALIGCAAIALISHHVSGMMIILVLLGTQAAFMGPVKYAILPELLRDDELLTGTGLLEGSTFVFILLGTSLGGLLILHTHGIAIVSASMLLMSVIGVIAAWAIPETKAALVRIPVPRNPITGLWSMIRVAFADRALSIPILGISWFWAIGAVFLTQMPLFTKEVLGGNEEVSTAFYAIFSVGVAVGSVMCSSISRHLSAHPLAILSLTLLCLFALDLCWIGYHATAAVPLMNLNEYLGSFSNIRIAVDLFMIAVCGGLFTVPLYLQLQTHSAPELRARTIASNNVMNAIFIATSSLVSAGLYAVGLNVMDVLLVFSLASLPLIAFMVRRASK